MDTTLLRELLQRKINERGVSIRESARQMGVAHTTITRFLDGTNNSVDIDTFLSMCEWMEISPANILEAEMEGGQRLGAILAALAESYPDVFAVINGAIDRVKVGELDPRTIADILAYITFRLKRE